MANVTINSIEADCCLTGVVHPLNGPLKKDLAWKAVKFGPVTAWSVNCDADAAHVSQHLAHRATVSCTSGNRPLYKTHTYLQPDSFNSLQVLLATSNAEYSCVKPASGYKKIFAHIAEQADILYEARFL